MGPDSGTNRVIRGGCFAGAPMDGFTANRYWGSPSDGSGVDSAFVGVSHPGSI